MQPSNKNIDRRMNSMLASKFNMEDRPDARERSTADLHASMLDFDACTLDLVWSMVFMERSMSGMHASIYLMQRRNYFFDV